ncbi:NADH-quinone oxidoreductase subunit J [Frankia sp. CNm7]|uniref:NADH-quinone oxidoreductase subunit J n=1 Tax=Frankia nepalensis TaxID=1836974 RepID=A0A937USX3_9ACTN|nr:NADH-quinone oxidoreductase subunit J [Frankia nepalensis]MBL7496071.1 NADH-quinone oxidoreductase subunit J [Frankia nepalensis]MBL7511140.1 NADH-quinone oxidoreductase subunit J [Frankia nepalensis]MBL7523394.1 NADH-quinone oxidoreductase subunit J [Frankia nepalensis]MBL7630675.1 NADH-quinone oxidoreductase subunit J [Frankia nepalensis]
MDPLLLAATAPITSTSTGEALTFWIIAPIAVIGALGMVLARSAVHGALMLVANLFCVAVCYLLQDAPFLGFVQIVVYTGAIMVLFLFVLMLIGVDSTESLVETLRGQRLAAAVLGLGFAGLLVFPLGKVIKDQPAAGLEAVNQAGGGNIHSIARLLFTDYVFAFEAVSALLVIAAVGAMVLGHRERTGPKPSQKETLRKRIADGGVLTPLPGPGVYARADSADQQPALPGAGRGLTGGAPAPLEPGGGSPAGDGAGETGDADGDDPPGATDGSAPVGAGKGSGL